MFTYRICYLKNLFLKMQFCLGNCLTIWLGIIFNISFILEETQNNYTSFLKLSWIGGYVTSRNPSGMGFLLPCPNNWWDVDPVESFSTFLAPFSSFVKWGYLTLFKLWMIIWDNLWEYFIKCNALYSSPLLISRTVIQSPTCY